VRTLHHYDEIGLLNPSARTAAGYRLYSDEDLERLQRILLYREVGFALDEIGDLVDDPSLGRREALLTQRDLIIERATRLDAMGRLIDKTQGSRPTTPARWTRRSGPGYSSTSGSTHARGGCTPSSARHT
jgi:DNA-binding transcriptional MerR regulator